MTQSCKGQAFSERFSLCIDGNWLPELCSSFIHWSPIGSALRMVKTKPKPTQAKFLLYVRFTFRQNAFSVSYRDVSAIEHLIRKGKRQLEMYEDTGVKDCFVSKTMIEWEEQQWKGITLKDACRISSQFLPPLESSPPTWISAASI